MSGDDDQAAPPDTAAGRASAFNPAPHRGQTCCGRNRKSPAEARGRGARCSSPRRSLVLVVLAGLAVGSEIIRNNYYVTQHDGTVSIMRGVQGSFLGIQLQEPYLLGCLERPK